MQIWLMVSHSDTSDGPEPPGRFDISCLGTDESTEQIPKVM